MYLGPRVSHSIPATGGRVPLVYRLAPEGREAENRDVTGLQPELQTMRWRAFCTSPTHAISASAVTSTHSASPQRTGASTRNAYSIIFSEAISTEVCPVAAFGPISMKKFGNPWTAVVLYAPGPPRAAKWSDRRVPPRPRIGSGRELLVLKPVAKTMTSAS